MQQSKVGKKGSRVIFEATRPEQLGIPSRAIVKLLEELEVKELSLAIKGTGLEKIGTYINS